jgi:ubiquinone biosynthesis monooxygenase Coq7
MRHYTLIDRIIGEADHALRTVYGRPVTTERPAPTEGIEEGELAERDRILAGGLMRVNHAGEIAAQALYQGQALTARIPEVRARLERAAQEENDHLVWCEQRIEELGARKSLLNPFWYAGSFAIGAIAGAAGDRWNLGFLAETERQVVQHLDRHLHRLPPQDARSRSVVTQMKEDEGRHADTAVDAGGTELPAPVKALMRLTSRMMTRTAFWI